MNQQGQFLMNLSHQIRTPMNSIMGLTNLLLSSPVNEEQKEYLQHINASSNMLMLLLNDVIELTRIQNQQMEESPSDFNFEDALKKVMNLLMPVASEKNLKLYYTFDREINNNVTGHPIQLQQLLLNIIGNAIKFTYKGEVNLRVNLVETGKFSQHIEIKVQDTGIGIEPDKLKSIFDFPDPKEINPRKRGGSWQ